MLIWNKTAETMPREALIKLQKQRLLSILKHAYLNVPFYQAMFDENKISHRDINSPDDLKELPFTTKADMQASYPCNMFAVRLFMPVPITKTTCGYRFVMITRRLLQKVLKDWGKRLKRCWSGIKLV